MARVRPTRKATPVEVTYLTAGQAPKLPDDSDDEDAEPASQRRPVFPGRENIEQIFRDAQRLAK